MNLKQVKTFFRHDNVKDLTSRFQYESDAMCESELQNAKKIKGVQLNAPMKLKKVLLF
jgi:hypothetical protein